jgi:uncharacterized protein (TIGR04255 family)
VAIEARYPDVAPLSEGEQGEMKRLLAAYFPLPQPIQMRTITATTGGPPTITEQAVPRFAARDQTTAVTVGPQAIVVETTKHQTFEHLAELLRIAVDARQRVAPVDGLLRLGLRYVDEIRVPDLCAGPAGWREWVHPSPNPARVSDHALRVGGCRTSGPDRGRSGGSYKSIICQQTRPELAQMSTSAPRERDASESS